MIPRVLPRSRGCQPAARRRGVGAGRKEGQGSEWDVRAVLEQSGCPLPARSPAAFSPGAGLPQLRRTPRRPGSSPSPNLKKSSPSSPGAPSSRSSWEGGRERPPAAAGRRQGAGGVAIWSGASAAGGGAGARQRTWRLGPQGTRAGL